MNHCNLRGILLFMEQIQSKKCLTLHGNRNIHKSLTRLNCSIITNWTICMGTDWENQSKGSS